MSESRPTLAVVANPTDAASSLLVVGGRTGAELISAAQALVLGSRALGGDIATVAPPTVAERRPYDAPAWIPTDRPVKFGELVDASDLQGVGYVPGTLRIAGAHEAGGAALIHLHRRERE